MRIGVDIMGGDYAPQEAVKGAILAKNELNDVELVLVGDKAIAEKYFAEEGVSAADFNIVHASEVIGMSEHPTKAISQKRDSSINVGFHLLKEKHIDAFVGAGNTGAMMVGAMFSVKAIEGILRPTITSILPKTSGALGVLLDIGANSDCKPEVLVQFGILGSLFAQHVYRIENPRVGLLSNGEEKGKGNLVTQATYPLMEECRSFNFVGNVEGRDMFIDKADVVVCDGFTGNIVLKACESIFYQMKKMGIENEYLDRFNYENYGGTPILGVNAPVIVGHGISKARSFVNMVKLAKDVSDTDLTGKIASAF